MNILSKVGKIARSIDDSQAYPNQTAQEQADQPTPYITSQSFHKIQRSKSTQNNELYQNTTRIANSSKQIICSDTLDHTSQLSNSSKFGFYKPLSVLDRSIYSKQSQLDTKIVASSRSGNRSRSRCRSRCRSGSRSISDKSYNSTVYTQTKVNQLTKQVMQGLKYDQWTSQQELFDFVFYQDQLDLQQQSPIQQNQVLIIKRQSNQKNNQKKRIYEVLNIMDNAGIIDRTNNNKYIRLTKSSNKLMHPHKTQTQPNTNPKQSQSQLFQQLQMKYEQSQDLQQKVNSLKKMIQRNIQKEYEQEEANKFMDQPIKKQKKIYYPFVSICDNNNQTDQIVVYKIKNKNQCFFNSTQNINMYGDLDIIHKLSNFKDELEDQNLQEFNTMKNRYTQFNKTFMKSEHDQVSTEHPRQYQ